VVEMRQFSRGSLYCSVNTTPFCYQRANQPAGCSEQRIGRPPTTHPTCIVGCFSRGGKTKSDSSNYVGNRISQIGTVVIEISAFLLLIRSYLPQAPREAAEKSESRFPAGWRPARNDKNKGILWHPSTPLRAGYKAGPFKAFRTGT
jgi:hypothetical protein